MLLLLIIKHMVRESQGREIKVQQKRSARLMREAKKLASHPVLLITNPVKMLNLDEDAKQMEA